MEALFVLQWAHDADRGRSQRSETGSGRRRRGQLRGRIEGEPRSSIGLLGRVPFSPVPGLQLVPVSILFLALGGGVPFGGWGVQFCV